MDFVEKINKSMDDAHLDILKGNSYQGMFRVYEIFIETIIQQQRDQLDEFSSCLESVKELRKMVERK